MTQTSLFAPHNGTDTSVLAAQRILPHVGTLESDVYNLLLQCPMTCDRAEQVLNLKHQTVSARIKGLIDKGLIEDSGRRSPTRSGSSAIVWEVKKGGDLHE